MRNLSRISSEDRLVMEELERKNKKQRKKDGKKTNRNSQVQQKKSEIKSDKRVDRNVENKSEKRVDRKVDNKYDRKVDKKSEKQARKEKKKQNNEIMRATVFFAVIFFAMVGYYGYFVTFESEKIVNNSYNSRLKTYSETIVRGNIYTGDGETIAYTETDENGKETRVYPYDKMFAHVVGMNSHGKTGIEKMCDYYLLTTNTNPILKVINEFKEEKSPGNDVVTTLDLKLQTAAYESLGDYDGAVVVLDNSTGKILAMVSKPDYNPNELEDMWDEIEKEDNEESFLLNRATQGLYTPGSSFKILTALEYIRQNKDYKNFSYVCDGKDTFANYTINCYNSTVHGTEDLTDAFAYSCNGAFAEIGTTLDMNKMSKNMNKLLFNSKLPISLEYSKSTFDLNNDSSTFDITQSSIGQGTTLVTPIHMAMIVQSIANDGKMMKPYVVSEIDGYNGEVIKSYKPEVYGDVMTKKEAKTLRTMMSAVTEYGTGKILANADYKSGGKTGTAQIDSKDNVNSWFAGYAKKGDKDISICAVIENVPDGSIKAVECAKEIFDSWFE